LAKKAVLVSAFASALALLSSAVGFAGATVPVRVSGPSPLAGCASQDAAQPGRLYMNAEVEPQIAVKGANMITMWHQDRWSNGGAHGIGVGVSNDGGTTWNESTMPWDACAPLTPPSLAGYLRNSDPWVSIGPDGIAYASGLSFNIQVPNWANAVAVSRSTDSGSTWDHTQAVPGSAFTTFSMSTDKNSTTADPTRNATAYTVWDTLIEPTDNPDDNPHTAAYTGPAYFSKTTDGGVTWNQAKVIVDTKNRSQTIGNIIVVDPRNGDLYDFTDLLLSPNTPFQGTRSNQQLAFVKSTDGGDHWTAPQVIAPFNALGVSDPNTGQPLRVGDGLEEVAVDAGGKLYAVWESSSNYQKQLKQSSGAWDDEVLLATSSNGGQTWTGPTVVERLSSGLPTFTPTIAVNGDTVAVTYYDFRNLAAGQTANLPTDYWVKYSTDGGATWGDEQHIAGSFDSMTAPVARGFFLGDYAGLQPSGTGFEAVFVKTNCDATDSTGQAFPTGGLCAPASSNVAPTTNTNPTDVFVTTLTP
jgi:hypothetical protein